MKSPFEAKVNVRYCGELLEVRGMYFPGTAGSREEPAEPPDFVVVEVKQGPYTLENVVSNIREDEELKRLCVEQLQCD